MSSRVPLSKKFILQTVLFSGIAFLILSMPTAVVKNQFFTRMTPVYWFDYLFLVINSVLIGLYYGLVFNNPSQKTCQVERKSYLAQGLSFLGIACPICNKILVLFFGVTFLLTFLEPIRPYISLFSTVMLIWLIGRRLNGTFVA